MIIKTQLLAIIVTFFTMLVSYTANASNSKVIHGSYIDNRGNSGKIINNSRNGNYVSASKTDWLLSQKTLKPLICVGALIISVILIYYRKKNITDKELIIIIGFIMFVLAIATGHVGDLLEYTSILK